MRLGWTSCIIFVLALCTCSVTAQSDAIYSGKVVPPKDPNGVRVVYTLVTPDDSVDPLPDPQDILDACAATMEVDPLRFAVINHHEVNPHKLVFYFDIIPPERAYGDLSVWPPAGNPQASIKRSRAIFRNFNRLCVENQAGASAMEICADGRVTRFCEVTAGSKFMYNRALDLFSYAGGFIALATLAYLIAMIALFKHLLGKPRMTVGVIDDIQFQIDELRATYAEYLVNHQATARLRASQRCCGSAKPTVIAPVTTDPNLMVVVQSESGPQLLPLASIAPGLMQPAMPLPGPIDLQAIPGNTDTPTSPRAQGSLSRTSQSGLVTPPAPETGPLATPRRRGSLDRSTPGLQPMASVAVVPRTPANGGDAGLSSSRGSISRALPPAAAPPSATLSRRGSLYARQGTMSPEFAALVQSPSRSSVSGSTSAAMYAAAAAAAFASSRGSGAARQSTSSSQLPPRHPTPPPNQSLQSEPRKSASEGVKSYRNLTDALYTDSPRHAESSTTNPSKAETGQLRPRPSLSTPPPPSDAPNADHASTTSAQMTTAPPAPQPSRDSIPSRLKVQVEDSESDLSEPISEVDSKSDLSESISEVDSEQ